MLAIVNVSPEDAPQYGINQYEVRVNNTVLASFEHDRQLGAAAQCLRDAADAVEKSNDEKFMEWFICEGLLDDRTNNQT